MTIQNNIPQGYKTTPLGIIPKEWKVKVLGDLCNSIKAGKNKEKENEGKYPVYGSTGLIGYTDIFAYDGSMILIARVGANAGFTYCINEKCDVSDNTLILNVKSCYNFNFAYNQLLYYNLNKLVFGSGQPLVTAGQLKALKIVLPPVFEQKKIAEVLGVWDKAIEKQTQLIKKLELRKKGLMQQLLTGKKRLPGFSDPWQTLHIKDFAFEINLRNKNSIISEVLSCTKYEGLVSSLEYFGKQIYSNDLSTYKIVPRNCFAYATNHIEEGSIGYQSKYDNALISPMYTVFGTDSKCVNDVFLYKLFKTQRLIYLYQSRMEGSIDRRGGLRWKDFSTIKLATPSIIEQMDIAEVLTAADHEIELAQQKLELLRQQKRGLMQQLLTGKKRIKI